MCDCVGVGVRAYVVSCDSMRVVVRSVCIVVFLCLWLCVCVVLTCVCLVLELMCEVVWFACCLHYVCVLVRVNVFGCSVCDVLCVVWCVCLVCWYLCCAVVCVCVLMCSCVLCAMYRVMLYGLVFVLLAVCVRMWRL